MNQLHNFPEGDANHLEIRRQFIFPSRQAIVKKSVGQDPQLYQESNNFPVH
ncbi:MAG: hypothetical protein VB912_01515 [Pirellulaceae bacterium]